MSGTSIDAIDAVLIECEGARFKRVVDTGSRAYPPALRSGLLELSRRGGGVTLETLCELDAAVAEAFARAALDLLTKTGLQAADISAIGSHGQTVYHRGGAQALTLQIGDAGRIAERTGITTIGDFRRRDIALGGQGAPLVPAFHHALFASPDEARAILNIGGIANLTLLPSAEDTTVRGFDTGPGNALLDEWCLLRNGQPHDLDGRWAASGTVHAPLLDALLQDPYFSAPPPKSTGRGDLHLPWARQRYPALDTLPAIDVQATFAELTAATIVDALLREQPATRRLVACGGGIRNSDLMRRIAARCGSGISIDTTARFGLDPQAVEGAAFAWLAMRTLDGLSGNLPTVTGAHRATVLGAIYR
jgi:anhydro-N-acetylmuramic acid kinase